MGTPNGEPKNIVGIWVYIYIYVCTFSCSYYILRVPCFGFPLKSLSGLGCCQVSGFGLRGYTGIDSMIYKDVQIGIKMFVRLRVLRGSTGAVSRP